VTDLVALHARDRKVDALEAGIRQLPAVEMPVEHHFSQGVYARELHIPAGTVLTGKIHKHQNLNILSKGDISVFLEDGSVMRVQAPFTVVSPPGTRRAAFAHTDVVWTTIHGTDETDVDEIERQFICQSPAEYLEYLEAQKELPMTTQTNMAAAGESLFAEVTP
jgi:hypothetical protein